jgi:hypothetical protein
MAGNDSRSLDLLLDEISVVAKSADFENASILINTAKNRCAIDSSTHDCSNIDRGIKQVVTVLSNSEKYSGVDVQLFRYSAGCFLSEMLLCVMRHGSIECAQKWLFGISHLLATALPSRK